MTGVQVCGSGCFLQGCWARLCLWQRIAGKVGICCRGRRGNSNPAGRAKAGQRRQEEGHTGPRRWRGTERLFTCQPASPHHAGNLDRAQKPQQGQKKAIGKIKITKNLWMRSPRREEPCSCKQCHNRTGSRTLGHVGRGASRHAPLVFGLYFSRISKCRGGLRFRATSGSQMRVNEEMNDGRGQASHLLG